MLFKSWNLQNILFVKRMKTRKKRFNQKSKGGKMPSEYIKDMFTNMLKKIIALFERFVNNFKKENNRAPIDEEMTIIWGVAVDEVIKNANYQSSNTPLSNTPPLSDNENIAAKNFARDLTKRSSDDYMVFRQKIFDNKKSTKKQKRMLKGGIKSGKITSGFTNTINS